jgi:hypothetical protein
VGCQSSHCHSLSVTLSLSLDDDDISKGGWGKGWGNMTQNCTKEWIKIGGKNIQFKSCGVCEGKS